MSGLERNMEKEKMKEEDFLVAVAAYTLQRKIATNERTDFGPSSSERNSGREERRAGKRDSSGV